MNRQDFIATRRKLGLSQEQLAHRLGITLRQLARIEAREDVPLRYQYALMWIEHTMQVDGAIAQ